MDGVGVLVGDLNAEFLLDGHDDLDGVKRVETEVVGEVSGGLDLFELVRQSNHDDPFSRHTLETSLTLKMTLASASILFGNC